MSGGTISILNTAGKALSVTITPVAGAATFLKSGGGTASFPVAITAAETFTTTSDGQFTLSVKYQGTEVAAAPDGTYTVELRQGCLFAIDPSPDAGYGYFSPGVTSTTTALEAVANAINTTGKYTGKMVWNTTTGLPLWADGPAAADTWSLATGVATHSPI